MPDDTVASLGDFIERVRRLRQLWNTSADKELWFRGERKNHEWKLRPKIYRPPENRRMRPIPELLKIENDLYEEFQRCGVQLCDPRVERRNGTGTGIFLCSIMGLPRACLTGRMER